MSAPSFSVLRFLKAQCKDICFFASKTRTVSCHSLCSRGATGPSGLVKKTIASATRCMTTSPRCQATVESSLLNLDFLRPAFKSAAPYFHASPTTSRPASSLPPNAVNPPRRKYTEVRPLMMRLWRRELWKQKDKQEDPRSRLNESPSLPSFVDDISGTGFGRNQSKKRINELKLRCTEFDENGNVTLMDGEFKKSELIAKACSQHK